MELRNRFKGLDLIDRVLEELWREVHDIVQEARIKTIPKKKKCKKTKWLSRRPYFAWKIPWMEEPGRLKSMELLRVRYY